MPDAESVKSLGGESCILEVGCNLTPLAASVRRVAGIYLSAPKSAQSALGDYLTA